MAIPWLTALKVIPWGDVITHAPAVLEKARDLMDRKRASTQSDAVVTPMSDDVPSLGELKNRLLEAHTQIAELQQQQVELSQTVRDLAEQNAALVSAVSGMRQTLRGLVLVSVLFGLGWLGMWAKAFF